MNEAVDSRRLTRSQGQRFVLNDLLFRCVQQLFLNIKKFFFVYRDGIIASFSVLSILTCLSLNSVSDNEVL